MTRAQDPCLVIVGLNERNDRFIRDVANAVQPVTRVIRHHRRVDADNACAGHDTAHVSAFVAVLNPDARRELFHAVSAYLSVTGSFNVGDLPVGSIAC